MIKLEHYGCMISRYGTAVLLLWFGVFKFTPEEAEAIRNLIENSPALSWLYEIASVQNVSIIIGVIEITAALGMLLYWLSLRFALIGDSLAILTFMFTLSFLFTTPNMFTMVSGIYFPAGGGFIIKDVLLLAAAFSAFYQDYHRLLSEKDEPTKTDAKERREASLMYLATYSVFGL